MINRLFAFLLLLVISPLFLFISIVVLCDDGMPILFKQKRVGKDGRIFRIYKIRTMKKNTPELSTNEIENIRNYLLRSGFLLRKFSLDELPNLINVVKGEMNFIGPRPLIRKENFMLEQRINLGINKLKPGITGWAQVNGRDMISDEHKLELEKYYLENKSIKLNFIIILKSLYYLLFSVRQKL
jgi:O-antigen biosynthesis protein WbqP